MPSWSDDAGNCHFDVNGTPCYLSKTGCPMHKGDWVWRSPTKATRQADIDAAFRRGAAAMRDTVADLFEGTADKAGLAAMPAWAKFIRTLPLPEETK